MKNKIIALLLVITASTEMMFSDGIKIGDLYYSLDSLQKTAYVVAGDYSDLTIANIPNYVVRGNGNYNVIGIAGNTFLNCNNLRSVKIGSNVSAIWNGAFSGCSNLESVTIGNQWIFIEGGAFGFSNVREIHYNGTINDWFQKTWYPTTIANNSHYSLYIEDSLITEIEIPQNISEINNYVFASCSSLKRLMIGNGVSIIGERAFNDCVNLEYVDFGNSVTNIGEKAFEFCKSIKTIYLPDSLKTIDRGAFRECKGLRNVSIGSGVLDIYEQAFTGCTNISLVSCSATAPPTMHTGISNWINEYIVFYAVDCSSIPLFVPEESVEVYASAEQWKEFNPIMSIREKDSVMHTIRFLNWNGDLLSEDILLENKIPQYIGDIPTREDDEQYKYSFVGWTPEIVAATEDAVYTATYKAIELGPITVHLNPQSCSAWSTVRLWAWTSNGNLFDAWPGIVMEPDENGWYSYSFDESLESVNIIWTDGTNQTIDINGVIESTCYSLNSTAGKYITVSIDSCPEHNPTDVEIIETNANDPVTKILRENQLLILREGKLYTITGQELKQL